MTMQHRIGFVLGLSFALSPMVLSAAMVGSTPVVSSAVSPASTCLQFSRTLLRGSRGNDVADLQKFLAAKGYFSGTSTGYFGALTEAAVKQWQSQNGIAGANSSGWGIFGARSRGYLSKQCGSSASGATGTGAGTTAGTTSGIQKINAPANVTLSLNGIAEVRNEHMYFTLQSIANNSATIQITPVGCWNSFPSDPPPQIRCMLAMLPTPPATLSIGQVYPSQNYTITLVGISGTIATFQVNDKGTRVQ